MENQSAKLSIKFTGKDLPQGTIDLYDLANTILATGQVVEQIAKNENFLENKKVKINVTTLKPGSFEVFLIITLVGLDIVRQVLFSVGGINQAKTILSIIGDIFKIKKFLKGEKPQKIIVNQEGKNPKVTIYNINTEKLEINLPVYRAINNSSINSNIKKIVQPLKKEGGNVESIKFYSDPELKTEVTKEEYDYFAKEEELQLVEEFNIKGIVTALDRKTGNGKITLANEKRVMFELDVMHPKDYERVEGIIIDSLKLKLNLFIKGKAEQDLSSNIKKIKIKDVIPEKGLF
jgi:hypothetical protein